jgi:xylose dehydrogenase (NAD/NADP)
MPVRLGLLSTARINDEILQGAAPSADIEVVAVGSRDPARAEAYAQEKAIPRAHGSYEELLGDPEVDAIYNSLPNSLHVPWTLRALEAACSWRSRSTAGPRRSSAHSTRPTRPG